MTPNEFQIALVFRYLKSWIDENGTFTERWIKERETPVKIDWNDLTNCKWKTK
jgi:hypothetical protein